MTAQQMITLTGKSENVARVIPRCSLSDLRLTAEVQGSLSAVLDDIRFEAALRDAGLRPRRLILLHGPSGCGKTSIAHGMASELGWPMFQVSLSATIGSHVGETGKEISKAMRFAGLNRVVLLLDEFDSLGSSRISGDSGADAEHNKSVNTMLTELDNNEPLGVIVACTNRLTALDPAVRRRFECIVEVPSMPRGELLALAKSIIGGRFGLNAEDALSGADSPATVTQRARDLLRSKVIEAAKLRDAEVEDMFEGKDPARAIIEKLQAGGKK